MHTPSSTNHNGKSSSLLHVSSNSMSSAHAINAIASSANRSTPLKPKKLSTDELRACYLEVPDLFFSPDFSLVKQDIFNQAILFSSTG